MSHLKQLLNNFRKSAKSEREKGQYFEELTLAYLKNEPSYQDLYQDVWTYSDWARANGKDARDS
jgi:predicted helicase